MVILLGNESVTPKPQNEGTDLEIVEALFHAVYWDIFVKLILSEKLDVKVDGFLVGRHLRVEGPDLQEDFGGTRIESMVIPVKKKGNGSKKAIIPNSVGPVETRIRKKGCQKPARFPCKNQQS